MNLVSIGTNPKIGCPGFSKAPVRDCGAACRVCSKDCYALKAYRQYPNVKAAWDKNGDIMRHNAFVGVIDIAAQLHRKRKLPTHFRIHVSGDFLTQYEVEAWSYLAEQFPTINFYAYTKAHHLDYSECPSNLTVRMSQWVGLPVAEGASFWLSTDPRRPSDCIPCTGACVECGHKCADSANVNIMVDPH